MWDKNNRLVIRFIKKNKEIIEIIMMVIQIISLVILYLTLKEMQVERNRSYQPDLVFGTTYYNISWTDEQLKLLDLDFLIDSKNIKINHTFDPNMDTVPGHEPDRLQSAVSNIGVGTAKNISITITENEIKEAIENFNKSCPNNKLEYQDYDTEVGDSIEFSDGKVAFGPVWYSAQPAYIDHLLSDHADEELYAFPAIYYVFIYGLIVDYRDHLYVDHIPTVPDLTMQITYSDVQGIEYVKSYILHTKVEILHAGVIMRATITQVTD